MKHLSQRKIILTGIIIIGIFLSIAFVPLINPKPYTLYSETGVILSGHYVVLFDYCKRGSYAFTFNTETNVDAYILNEAQYYAFVNEVYSGSLTNFTYSSSETLMLVNPVDQNLYFLLQNNNENDTELKVFKIVVDPPRRTILSFIFSR